MAKAGKKYRKLAELVDPVKEYSLEEAIDLLKQTSPTKFDASCEVHVHLGIDLKKSDQLVRDTVALPNGTGKDVKVVAFVTDDKIKAAKDAGATEAGSEELIAKITKGWLDFDIAIATPEVMRQLGKIAKILGQRGMMPNPKAGTITADPAKTIAELKKGKIEFRNDKTGNLHNVFGKVSFDKEKLLENLKTYLKAIQNSKPASVKGTFITNISVCTTMGPGIKVERKPV